jgi:hypothetical protein
VFYEIIKCIQKLKNNKAGGEDAIINEYTKTTSNQFIEIYEKLFNLIFDTGFIPESQSLTQNSRKKFTQTAN